MLLAGTYMVARVTAVCVVRALSAEAPVVGFCFSFPMAQTALNKGVLLDWTKGFTCSGGRAAGGREAGGTGAGELGRHRVQGYGNLGGEGGQKQEALPRIHPPHTHPWRVCLTCRRFHRMYNKTPLFTHPPPSLPPCRRHR